MSALGITFDDNPNGPEMPLYKRGNVLRGRVHFAPERTLYLNSITLSLQRTVAARLPIDVHMSSEESAQIEEHELFGKTRSVQDLGRALRGRDIKYGVASRKVIAQQRIAGEHTPSFSNAVSSGSNYSWPFEFPVPSAPWSYSGRLFTITWSVTAEADIRRSRLALRRQSLVAATQFIIDPS